VPTEHAVDFSEETVARAVGVLGLVGIAIIHLIDSVGTFSETRYIFWLYVALIVGCVALAVALLFARRVDPALAWSAVVILALAPLIGFILSRSTGLPADGDDIGNWSEPLGLVSMFVETLVVALGVWRAAAATGQARVRGGT
jgi:hypothetical protein